MSTDRQVHHSWTVLPLVLALTGTPSLPVWAEDEFDLDCGLRWSVNVNGNEVYLGQSFDQARKVFRLKKGLSGRGSYWREKNGGYPWWTDAHNRGFLAWKRTKATDVLFSGQGAEAVVVAFNARPFFSAGFYSFISREEWEYRLTLMEERWGAPRLRRVPITKTHYYELFGFKKPVKKWIATEWEDPACGIVVTTFARSEGALRPRVAVFSPADIQAE